MPGEFKEGTGEVLGEKVSAELEEVSLHGDSRDCVRTHSLERRNRGR